MVLVVNSNKAFEILDGMKKKEQFKNARIIGRVKKSSSEPMVGLETYIGGKIILRELDDLILPRIC